MEEKLKQAIKLFNEILEWNYSFDNQDEIKPELRDKIESFINEFEKEQSAGNQTNSENANCAIFDVSNSLLLDESNDIDTIGKCANCGIEFHIHKKQ